MPVGPGSVIRVPGISQVGKLPTSADKAAFQAAFLAANGAIPDEPFAIFDKCFHLLLGEFAVGGTFDHFGGHVANFLGAFTSAYGFAAGAGALPVSASDVLLNSGSGFFYGNTFFNFGVSQLTKFDRSLTRVGFLPFTTTNALFPPPHNGAIGGYATFNGKVYVLGAFDTIDVGAGPATRSDVAVYDPTSLTILPDHPLMPISSFWALVAAGTPTDYYIGGTQYTLSGGMPVFHNSDIYKYNGTTHLIDPLFTVSITGPSGTLLTGKMVTDIPRNRLYFYGQFSSVNGSSRTGVAAVDLTTGAVVTAFNPVIMQSGSPAPVAAMAVDPTTGNVFVSCTVTSINGTPFSTSGPLFGPIPVVAAFDPSGNLLFAVTAVASSGPFSSNIQVEDLLVTGSDLIVVGAFTALGLYGGATTSRTGIATVDTTTGAVTALNLPLTSSSGAPSSPLRLASTS